MNKIKTVLLEAHYEKNNYSELFFELRKKAHENLIEHKAKTGSYQKNSYDFPNFIKALDCPSTYNLLMKNKKYLEII